MPNPFDAFVMEVEQEAKATRRHLEAVPEDKFDWKPHAKSKSLGELAMHVAASAGEMVPNFKLDVWEPSPEEFSETKAETVQDLLEAHDKSTAALKEFFSSLDEKSAMGTWKFIFAGNELMAGPRIAMVRPFLLGHTYHHRAQLGVYLRLLDIPVPATYGPSADDNPFG